MSVSRCSHLRCDCLFSSGDGVDCSRVTICCITAMWCYRWISIPIIPVGSGFARGLTPSCFLGGLLSYRSPVVFLDRWYPRFGNFRNFAMIQMVTRAVRPIAWWRLTVSNRNVATYISSEYIMRQTIKRFIITYHHNQQ